MAPSWPTTPTRRGCWPRCPASSRPLSKAELALSSPYNTRNRAGLPPTPIGNPGLASIKAAAHPARTRYLYFVRKPGKSGEHAFSRTDAQFQRDYERYQESRDGP